MELHIFEILIVTLTGLLTAVVGVIWTRADKAAKTSELNSVLLQELSKQVSKSNDLSGRLSSLEASFSAEIKNLSVSIKRMESALIRIDQNAPHRTR